MRLFLAVVSFAFTLSSHAVCVPSSSVSEFYLSIKIGVEQPLGKPPLQKLDLSYAEIAELLADSAWEGGFMSFRFLELKTSVEFGNPKVKENGDIELSFTQTRDLKKAQSWNGCSGSETVEKRAQEEGDDITRDRAFVFKNDTTNVTFQTQSYGNWVMSNLEVYINEAGDHFFAFLVVSEQDALPMQYFLKRPNQ